MMVPHILFFDKTGKLLGEVKEGKLVDEKGGMIREITNPSIKISDLIKELIQRKISGYLA